MKPIHYILLAVVAGIAIADKQTGILAAALAGLFFVLHIYNGVPSELPIKKPAPPKDNQPRDPNL